MKQQFIRVWKELDVNDIKEHLLVVGHASGMCENCNSLVEYREKACPKCASQFRYVALRSEISHDASFYRKLKDVFSDFVCIDYSDYKKLAAKSKAKDIFKKK